MKSQLITLVFFVFFIIVRICPATSQEIIFNKVPAPDNRNFNFVTGIAQDVNGIMWFSTKVGLFSYDGSQLTSFKYNPLNPNSIQSNELESVCADSNGTIWIGFLGSGLDCFDPVTGIFTHYRHDPNDPGSIANDTVTALLQDTHGILWIGTHGGLDRYDPKTNTFAHYRHQANDSTSISNNQVRTLYEDRQGNLWIGTGSPYPGDGGGPADGGLNRMNKNSGTFTRYLHDPKNSNSLINNKVSAIYEDTDGVFWVGTAKNGLHKMNRQTGTFERIIYDLAHPKTLSGPPVNNEADLYEHISFMIQDASGSYWIGSSHAGINYYNSLEGKTVHYSGNTNPAAGFTDNGAWHAFNSRDGILWIGCPDPLGNIYRINPLRKEIPHHQTSGGYVLSFYEEPSGSLWIGTSNGLIHKDEEIVSRYLSSTIPSKNNDNAVHEIIEDGQGDIWIGGARGLAVWNKKNQNFRNYKYEPGNPNSLSNPNVFTIMEDSEANLWIGTFRGLNLLDRNTGLFTQYILHPTDTSSFGKNFVTSICKDKAGKIWISAWFGGGVALLNRENNQLKHYLKDANVVCILEDADNVIWAGSDRGLYKYDKDVDNFIRFNDPVSLNDISNIYNMLEDNRGILWLGTSDGIMRINRERNETRLFGKNYGVGNNGMSYGGSYKGLDGKLYFGDGAGYFSFDPAGLVANLRPPEIIISGFRLADQAIKPGDGGPLKESLLRAKEIFLSYNQNIFSFDISVIDYADPEQNRLYFLLENYETNWRQANSERRVYYFNIPPGEYILQLKASNGYGTWAEKKIAVIILPPWWKTWWAYFFYAFLLIAAIFSFDRFMRRRIKMAERRRSQERELKQAKEIEKAYTELKATQSQLIQSEKMASLGELTAGIAHEIQNPLNFVNNFSEVSRELINEMNDELAVGNWQLAKEISEDIDQNLEKINHHGKRADAIVKGMLQHSRTNTGQKDPTDINALADEYLRLSYHGLRAKDKSFNADFKTDFDPNLPKINVIPQDIGRVLLNLINNAFYAVAERQKNLTGFQNLSGLEETYKPTVTVSTKSMGESIEIAVKDNGNGIPEEIKNKIFQPFFTTKPTGQGTGLGLSLSYDIVKAHGGELKVDSAEGAGTEFKIVLTK